MRLIVLRGLQDDSNAPRITHARSSNQEIVHAKAQVLTLWAAEGLNFAPLRENSY